jgi:hypothetical protein
MRKKDEPLKADTVFIKPDGTILPVEGMPKDELRRRATQWNRDALLGAGFKENHPDKKNDNNKRQHRN